MSNTTAAVTSATTPAVDIDDIEIKAEDVYAFRDIDIHIPPVAAMHKPRLACPQNLFKLFFSIGYELVLYWYIVIPVCEVGETIFRSLRVLRGPRTVIDKSEK